MEMVYLHERHAGMANWTDLSATSQHLVDLARIIPTSLHLDQIDNTSL